MAMMLGYIKNPQHVLYHSHLGQGGRGTLKIYRWGGVECFQCGHNQKMGDIGRSSFLKKGGPKARAKPLRRAEGGRVRKGGVYHTTIYISSHPMHARKFKNEMSLDALWLI